MDSGAVTGVISGIPTDWIILGILGVFLVLLAMYSGVVNLLAISLGGLVTSALAPLVASTALLSGLTKEGQGLSPLVFLGLFVPLFVMMRWMTRDTFEVVGPIQAILAGMATVVIVLVIWQQMPGLSSVWDFGGNIDALFAERFQLWWLLGALLALAFAKR
jgi:hypothetical protein